MITSILSTSKTTGKDYYRDFFFFFGAMEVSANKLQLLAVSTNDWKKNLEMFFAQVLSLNESGLYEMLIINEQ